MINATKPLLRIQNPWHVINLRKKRKTQEKLIELFHPGPDTNNVDAPGRL